MRSTVPRNGTVIGRPNPPETTTIATQIARKTATSTRARFRNVQPSAAIPANASGHTRYHCSSTASDHRWRSSGGSVAE